MNANSLAIVFAPCILRTNKTRQVQESLSDISRQTMCIETIIAEQLKKVKATLNNIESVDSATHSFSVRLNSIRSSKVSPTIMFSLSYTYTT
jgi:myosin-9